MLVSYPTLSVGLHFIHSLPGAGKACTQDCCIGGGFRQLTADSLMKYTSVVLHNLSIRWIDQRSMSD